MNLRTLRRRRRHLMAKLVKVHPRMRGTPKAGIRPFILVMHSDGTSVDLSHTALNRRRQRWHRERERLYRAAAWNELKRRVEAKDIRLPTDDELRQFTAAPPVQITYIPLP